MKKIAFILSIILLVSVSCNQGNRKSAGKTTTPPFKQFELMELWSTDSVFLIPESVIYDKVRNVLYVSDLNYEPRMKDGNGFISILGTDGKILNLRWIEGLSSPKGMAIIGDTLYAADVDELVLMDINRGLIIRKILIDSVKMINDITSDPEKNLYISDSDANRIYKYSNGHITNWLTVGLNAPNGLLADGERILVASMGSMDFTSYDIKTKAKTVLTDGINKGDGIAYTGIPGYYIVTDWFGEIFLINPDYTKVSLLNKKAEQINSADIAYIPELNMLLVPTFNKKNIVAYKLVEK
ncbi:MAG: hypothetical protein MUC93_06455 [Bacteroidales bacterium]|jgi:hypothetical protein|nr:hypothetical protein [Bacteroidales bacterium]